MIVQPHFPSSLTKLVHKIVNSESQVDCAKAKIEPSKAEQLFNLIDHLQCGEIFMEDLYAFLKRKGCSLSKKEIKFLNKYFGFSAHEKLTQEIFRKKFITFSNPDLLGVQKQQNQEQALLQMIKLALECYNQIQMIRIKIVENVEQIYECLQEFYPQSPVALTKPMLKQMLSCLNIYSRLNANYLCNYILGEQISSVSLKHVFWKQISSNGNSIIEVEPTYENKDFGKKLNNFICNRQEKRQGGGVDILSQIQNIETAYKEKLQHSHMQKTAGLIHRFSDVQKLSQSRLPSKDKQFAFRNKSPNKIDELNQREMHNPHTDLDQILKRSLEEYKKDEIEKRQAQIDSLYRKRKNTQVKQGSVSRTPSAAKLKIQEIEKRVFSRNKITNVSNPSMRTSSHSITLSNQVRSRFSSIKRK